MKTKKNKAIFTLYIDGFPKFAFHARDEQEALSKARGWWVGYHKRSPQDTLGFTVKPATENEKANWLHDEYVD